MSPATAATMFSPESMSASGKSTSQTNLLSLQSKMKSDPTGYVSELRLLVCRFDSFLSLYRVNSSLNPISDPNIAKELGDLAMFLAHVSPFYDGEVKDLPKWIKELLENGKMLPSSLRIHLTQALILLVNRKVVGIEETLELFMDLQLLDDRASRKLAFSHVVHTIRRMNQNHRNEAQNRKLQNVLFSMLEGVDEARAKRALVILCDLHRRKVWFDERTANAICQACYHTSSRILKSALLFLLGYDRVDDDDSDESDSEDDTSLKAQVVLSRDAVYKAHHKGTVASKKKKKAKLQRVMRSMKRQQRLASENTGSNFYSPLTQLKDAQGFAEKLFSRLQKCNERFEVKMMMLKVIARAIGMHHLILLNFYPYLQRYVQPHQQDITELLAAAVQACHYMVPPDAVEPLFKQVVNQFVHDRSRTEAIAVGLNVVREICIRMPLLMNEDLLQDLVLYKKSHEKAISTAARSLMTLFREICPSLLVKKDRGRPTNPKAKPKAFGEVNVASDVAGLELLKEDSSAQSSSDDELDTCEDENETEDDSISIEKEDMDEEDEEDEEDEDREDDDMENIDEVDVNSIDDDDDEKEDDDSDGDDIDENVSGDDIDENASGDDIDENVSGDDEDGNLSEKSDESNEKIKESKNQKRKFSEYIGQLNAAELSLRALKKLATNTVVNTTETEDGILSNEDFQRIRELKAKKEAKLAMGQHGLAKKGSDSKASPFKIPSADQLSSKLVDPNKLEANIRRKMTKEQRLELVRAGREDRGKYQARAAVKKKKTGGQSNKEKEHKKAMPLAAKRAKVARSRHEKKMHARHAGKQFRGKKAWK